MPTKKKPVKRKKAATKNPALKQLEGLRKTVKQLRVKLERETRARKIEARVKSEAQKARAQLGSQIAALRDQGRKLASDLKSALGDSRKRDAARQQAVAQDRGAEGGVFEEVDRAQVGAIARDVGAGTQIRGAEEAGRRNGAARGRYNSRRRASSGCPRRRWAEARKSHTRSRPRKLKTAETIRSPTKSSSRRRTENITGQAENRTRLSPVKDFVEFFPEVRTVCESPARRRL